MPFWEFSLVRKIQSDCCCRCLKTGTEYTVPVEYMPTLAVNENSGEDGQL